MRPQQPAELVSTWRSSHAEEPQERVINLRLTMTFVIGFLMVLVYIAYIFLGPKGLEVGSVQVTNNGYGLTVSYVPCKGNDPARVDLKEYYDHVELDIEVDDCGCDCMGMVEVALREPLLNRVVMVGPPAQYFEFCGSETLCPA